MLENIITPDLTFSFFLCRFYYMITPDINDHIPGTRYQDLKIDEHQNFINSYIDYQYNYTLREKYPNSFFLPEYYDESIEGIDETSGSIKYDWKYVGYLYMIYMEDILSPDLNQNIQGAIIMFEYVEKLSEDNLMGKVKPIIQVSDYYYDNVDE